MTLDKCETPVARLLDELCKLVQSRGNHFSDGWSHRPTVQFLARHSDCQILLIKSRYSLLSMRSNNWK